MEYETRTLARNCLFKSGWERIGLTQAEVDTVDEAVRKKNLELLKDSIVDASEIFPLAVFPDGARWQFAVTLFEGRRQNVYTALKEALDNKIAALRARGYGNGEALPSESPPAYGAGQG